MINFLIINLLATSATYSTHLLVSHHRYRALLIKRLSQTSSSSHFSPKQMILLVCLVRLQGTYHHRCASKHITSSRVQCVRKKSHSERWPETDRIVSSVMTLSLRRSIRSVIHSNWTTSSSSRSPATSNGMRGVPCVFDAYQNELVRLWRSKSTVSLRSLARPRCGCVDVSITALAPLIVRNIPIDVDMVIERARRRPASHVRITMTD